MTQQQQQIITRYGVQIAALMIGTTEKAVRYAIEKYCLNVDDKKQQNINIANCLKRSI